MSEKTFATPSLVIGKATVSKSGKLKKRRAKAGQEVSGNTSHNESQAILQHTSFQGPNPHPDLLAKYEAILPGAADRILQMAEMESAHRHSLEKYDAEAAFELNRRNESLSFFSGLCGQIVAGIITVASITGGVICILNGQIWTGGFLGGLPIVSIVYIFIAYREPKIKNNNQPNT
ncbi:MAG TPA: DUF2335 domain-containing protein [Phycisphaerales bacterium]|nr:DUF2335 domain-containing protein [Phycisphaerales bacterium]